jgi:transketolase
MLSPREQFAKTMASIIRSHRQVALVYAEISGRFFGGIERERPLQVINVGIREQALISVGAGLAMAGLRPFVHTFSSFLVERPFEQIKLDFAHQGVGGVLVSVGASYDYADAGRTHQAPGDIALLDTIPGIRISAPGNAAELAQLMSETATRADLHYIRVSDQVNSHAFDLSSGKLQVVRRGVGPVVVACGPTLDQVLAATANLEATIAYTHNIRPFDSSGLRQLLGPTGEVVLVEPWLQGTSAHVVSAALVDRPHRLLCIGVGRDEVRHYGTAAQHATRHGLDATGITHQLAQFLGRPEATGLPSRASRPAQAMPPVRGLRSSP